MSHFHSAITNKMIDVSMKLHKYIPSVRQIITIHAFQSRRVPRLLLLTVRHTHTHTYNTGRVFVYVRTLCAYKCAKVVHR